MIVVGILILYGILLVFIGVLVFFTLLVMRIKRKFVKWNKFNNLIDVTTYADYILVDIDILKNKEKIDFLLNLQYSNVSINILSPIFQKAVEMQAEMSDFAYDLNRLLLLGVHKIDFETSENDILDIYIDYISQKANTDKMLIVTENMDMRKKVYDFYEKKHLSFKPFVTQLASKK